MSSIRANYHPPKQIDIAFCFRRELMTFFSFQLLLFINANSTIKRKEISFGQFHVTKLYSVIEDWLIRLDEQLSNLKWMTKFRRTKAVPNMQSVEPLSICRMELLSLFILAYTAFCLTEQLLCYQLGKVTAHTNVCVTLPLFGVLVTKASWKRRQTMFIRHAAISSTAYSEEVRGTTD